jgi:hypothetical protein
MGNPTTSENDGLQVSELGRRQRQPQAGVDRGLEDGHDK